MLPGQAVAVVQDGGGQLAGQGVPGAAAVAVCLAGAVAAAPVQGVQQPVHRLRRHRMPLGGQLARDPAGQPVR